MDDNRFIILSREILAEGTNKLELPLGIVSHIEDNLYEVMAVEDRLGVFVAGESYPLDQTYCREVYEKGRTMAITTHGEDTRLKKHPLYEELPLEAYISTPISLGASIYGTLNFSCMKRKRSEFTDEEIEYVEEMALILSECLSSS